jgi:signal transduction histidine kinase
MDAIGRLAGGLAHDFNNLLTIITSYSELALDSVESGSCTEARLQEILSAARRAAALTRQLLAFSRQQRLTRRCIGQQESWINHPSGYHRWRDASHERGQLAKELDGARPETRALFVCGYAGQAMLDCGPNSVPAHLEETVKHR